MKNKTKPCLFLTYRKLVLLFSFISVFNVLLAQRGRPVVERAPDEKLAKDLFAMRNFREALEEYKLLYKKDSLNLTYNYRLGICYLNVNIDRSLALPYLEYAVEHPKIEVDAWYELGRCYMNNYRFEDAINAFKTFQKLKNGKNDKFSVPASRQIQMCRNGIELMKNPINVSFENMGAQINSAYPDFSPFIPADASFMIFTSKRDKNIGKLLDFDGFYTSDIYISGMRNNSWGKAKSIGTLLNSDLVEEVGGLSADGNTIFIYIDNYVGFNDVIWSQRKGRSFMKGVPMSPNINSDMLETSATISPDYSMIVFAAERQTSYGGTDLFFSKRLPSDEWSQPTNLGNLINTMYNEEFPNFSADGKTLYFSSQGHNSMGGYDLFQTTWDSITQSWTPPVNLGYPLNTPEDNMSISFSKSGRYAFTAAFREDSYGDLDIYKVTFEDVPPPYTILKGNIINSDSSNIYSYILPVDQNNETSALYISSVNDDINRNDNDITLLKINVHDKNSGELIGQYAPNKITGRYTVILTPGEYKISFFGKGLKEHNEEISIFDAGFENREIIKDIVMWPSDTVAEPLKY